MRVSHLAVVVTLASVGCSGDDNPASPTPTVSSVTVAPANPGGTIFIGETTQFQATSTLSNGQTEIRAGTWGSDNTDVATVDQNGLVTGVAAGEATIFVDVNPRGQLLIRVFPDFGGSWAGNEVPTGCQDSGAFAGVCNAPDAPQVGEVFAHGSMFVQTEASVDAVIDRVDGTSASMTGTITVGGRLDLPSAPVLPADPDVNAQVENWRSRADDPSEMTGTYEVFLTVPGFSGSVRVMLQLENVFRTTAATAASLNGGGSARARIRDLVAAHLERQR